MERYSGEDLGDNPHIVVLGSCKVGNFVVSTPTLQALKNRFPNSVLGFIGSDVTSDFESSLSSIDWRISWDANFPDAGLRLLQELATLRKQFGNVDLALNLDGFNPVTCTLVPWLHPRYVAGGSLTQNLRRQLPCGTLPQQSFLEDSDWDSPLFLERYADIFQSNYIAELFMQLAFVKRYGDPTKVLLPTASPPFPLPDVLIHCTTAREAKIWPFEFWKVVIDHLSSQGISVGLVGSSPSRQQAAYNSGSGEDELLSTTSLIDFRGKTTLMQLAGACQRVRAVVTVDAGPLHIAAAVGVPTLAVVGNDVEGFGSSPIRLWMPRSPLVERTVSDYSCSLCSDNRFRNDACLVDGHPCMRAVKPQQVIEWLDNALKRS